ncbi:DZIP3 [Branchiostoma lanceolatum]|uniref:DZIP3 protein n=1 Tax=Branchiostoma lanceolatum TaxID=7740 RepID=A0A8J9Z1S8_BRALA|nr:DZIP3 [Branchiostoma lanceolatum]
MATGGDPVYTPETANGARLQALLIDEGTPLVRKVFDDKVKTMNPPDLRDQLLRQRNDLEGYLDPSQLEKVYPGGGVANSSEHFDMSLLCLLLGRLCHMRPPKTGWGEEPPVGDKSPIAWIIRLRLFRNDNYGHITSTALSNTKFKKLWKKLSDILRGLGGDQNKILKRKTQTIDPEQAKMYREKFERLHRQDNEVKDLIVAQGAQTAAQWGSLAEDIQRQTSSESKKTRKELRNIKGAHGKQHKQIMGKFEEEQTALKTFGQQQNKLFQKVAGLTEGLQPICAEVQKQSADMKELKDKVYDFTQGENPTPDRTMQSVKDHCK